METKTTLRTKTLTMLEQIAHYHLLMNERLLTQALKAYNPGEPRVPTGNSDGGQWTAVGGGAGSGNSGGIVENPLPTSDSPISEYPHTPRGSGVVLNEGDDSNDDGNGEGNEGDDSTDIPSPENGGLYSTEGGNIYNDKIAEQMIQRGWTNEDIDAAQKYGDRIDAVNMTNGTPYSPATRYVHPDTEASVVIDNSTNQVIHVGEPDFINNVNTGDAPGAVMRSSPNVRAIGPEGVGEPAGVEGAEGGSIGGGGIFRGPIKPALGEMEE